MTGDVSSSGQKADSGQVQDSSDPVRSGVPDVPLALYRRYRPATFAEVKGQDHVTEPLRQALRSGRVHHAYLFSGPRGCGKTSSARILARSLNCEVGPTPDPCGKCASCIALGPAGAGSIDVIEIDAASHGGIDDARDLRERAFYSPVAARYKIYIIDEAHMVTGAGFNALLKLVEEPPPHLKFVFATTEPEKVIPTIRSRTHHYPFRLVPPAVLRELLEEILSAEGIDYEPSILPVVIRAGAGSVRDTLSVVDQLIAGSDESGLRYDRAIALLGYTDDALLDEMADAFAAGDGAAVFVAIDHVVEAGHDPRRFAMDLLDRLRDLIVLAAVPGAAASGLLDVPEDGLERMRGQAARFGQERLVRAAETISNGLVEMRGATSPRLLLELMCAQALLPADAPAATSALAASGGSDVLARVERLERQLAAATGTGQPSGAVRPEAERAAGGLQRRDVDAGHADSQRSEVRQAAAPQAGTAQARAPEAGRGETPGASGGKIPAIVDVATLRNRWPQVLDSVREIRKTAWILLSSYATVESVEGNVLTLAFDTEGNARGFASSGSDSDLAEVLGSLLGARPAIRTIVRPGAVRGGRPVGAGPATESGVGGSVGDEQPASQPEAAGADAGREQETGGARNAARDAGTLASSSTVGEERAGGAGEPVESDGDRSGGADPPDESGEPHESSKPGESGEPREVHAIGGPSAAGEADGADSDDVDQGSGRARNGTRRRNRQDSAGPAVSRQRTTHAAAAGPQSRPSPGTTDLSPPDVPRPVTDGTQADVADELTGSELIMRELGGRVIEEVGEV